MFDLIGDRSFGAFMLSILPISVISLICILVGPFLAKENRHIALKNWLVGTTLVLGVALIFSSLGEEQAKAGELIFTYAAIIMVFPSSLSFPVVLNWAEPYMKNSVMMRLACAWAFCLIAGAVQWWLLGRLRDIVSQRRARVR
ncbi:hypothetical protein ACFOLJ_29705 [Rugamonas sp. CCM 8940]